MYAAESGVNPTPGAVAKSSTTTPKRASRHTTIRSAPFCEGSVITVLRIRPGWYSKQRWMLACVRMVPSMLGSETPTLALAIATDDLGVLTAAPSNFAISPTTSLILDLVRGLAAVAVFVGHFLNTFFVNYAGIENKTVGARALYSTAGFGVVAVVIFFVMSGFVIGASALRSRQQCRFGWKLYCGDRVTRLYLVLLPALLLGLAWDTAGMRLFGTAGVYGATLGDVVTVPVSRTTTVGTYVMNALFLQKFFSEPAGSNSPLWTLSYEFWCYAALPLLIVPRRFIHKGVVAGFGILAAYFLIQKGLGVFLLFWLCGVGIAFTIPLRRKENPNVMLAVLSTAFFVYSLAASRFLTNQVSREGFLVAAGTSLFLFGLARWWPRQIPKYLVAWKIPAGVLAGFSYTLYLTHYPLLVFIAAWSIRGERWQPDPASIWKGVAIFGGTLLYAYGVSRLTEAHTGDVRRWFLRNSPAS